MNEIVKLWADCLNDLEELLNDQVKFDTFYKSAKLIEFKNGLARLVVEMQLQKMVLSNDKEILKDAISHRFNVTCDEIEIVLKDDLENQQETPEPLVEIKSNLREEFTFEQFVVGTSNKVAQAASLAVAINPGESFNPLFIYGNSGLGKTHLINAIGNETELLDFQ